MSWTAVATVCVALTLVLGPAVGQTLHDTPTPTVDVTTKTGPVRGRTYSVAVAGGKKIDVFLGIPYATPPVGDLRFEPPQYPHASWAEVREAFTFGDSCIQDMHSQHVPGVMSEDCLYLNVYAALRPANVSSLPVMLWIYGGGFRDGSSTLYDASFLSTLGDVVVVTVNYRLGALGFLASTDKSLVPGNMGLKDQLAAMQWVRDNIATFGGDPERVTIFGESAGSASVSLQLLSPKTAGLYIHAIAESGSALCPWALAMQGDRSDAAVDLARNLGCAQGSSVSMACLRNVSATQILDAQNKVYASWSLANRGTAFIPVVDGDYIPTDPITAFKNKQFNKVELLSGVNHDEWALFVMDHVDKTNPGINATAFEYYVSRYTELGFWGFPNGRGNTALLETVKFAYVDWFNPHSDFQRLLQLIKAGSDFAFMCPFQTTASYWSAAAKLYMYQYSHVDGHYPSWAGVPHAAEVFYVFGLPLVLPQESHPLPLLEATQPGLDNLKYNEADRLVSHNIINIWTRFAWTGDPSSGLPASSAVKAWPVYNITNRPYVNLDTEITLGSYLHNDKCEMFSQLAPILRDDCR